MINIYKLMNMTIINISKMIMMNIFMGKVYNLQIIHNIISVKIINKKMKNNINNKFL